MGVQALINIGHIAKKQDIWQPFILFIYMFLLNWNINQNY